MNRAIRDIDGLIADGDSFHNARFPNLRVENIADPPFNVSDRRSDLLRDDPQTGRAACETRHLNTGTAS